MSELVGLLAPERTQLTTLFNGMSLPMLEWASVSLPIWIDQGKIAEEGIVAANASHKPSDYVLAVKEPLYAIAQTGDTCPLLVSSYVAVRASADDHLQRAIFNGQILAFIENYLKSIGIGSGKFISILPQIIAIIKNAAASGGTIDWMAILALILQLVKPTPAPATT